MMIVDYISIRRLVRFFGNIYGRLNVLRWLLWEGERCTDEMPALDHRPPPDSGGGGGHGGPATTLALHYAAARGCLDCVRLLVDSTPDLR
nr:unnamed protein product [Callosobruchus analis]